MPKLCQRAIGIAIFVCATLFIVSTVQVRAERDCEDSFSPIGSLLKKAAAEIKVKDTVSAAADYDSAMPELAAVPWAPPDQKCDPDRFRFQKFLITIQSLVVAIDLGRLHPTEAQTLEAKILAQIYSLVRPTPEPTAGNHADISVSPSQGGMQVGVSVGGAPSGADEYYYTHYRPLYDEYTAYAKEIGDRWSAERIALHSPSSDNCSAPNVDPEPFIPAVIVRSGIVDGNYTAAVDVQLAEDGKVLRATMRDSSGNRYFDDTVMKEALQTKYLPAIANCKRVPAVYVFTSHAQITH